MKKPILLASAETLDKLRRLVEEYFMGSAKNFFKVSDGLWDVFGAKGKMEAYRVIYKNRRYRFEQIL